MSNGNISGQSNVDSNVLAITFHVEGEPGSACHITEVSLLKDGKVDEVLHVGDVQDTSLAHQAVVSIENSQWSAPQKADSNFFRSLVLHRDENTTARGTVVFNSFIFEEAEYALRIRYRADLAPSVSMSANWNGVPIQEPVILPIQDSSWVEWETIIKHPPKIQPVAKYTKDLSGPEGKTPAIARWDSNGSVAFDKVCLQGVDGREQAVFAAGDSLTLSVVIRAREKGYYNLILTAPLFRLDGILVTKFRTEPTTLDLEEDAIKEFQLSLDPINLGNGSYVFSLGLFNHTIDEQNRLDLIDRSFEFQVVGNDAFLTQVIFRHTGIWKLVHGE